MYFVGYNMYCRIYPNHQKCSHFECLMCCFCVLSFFTSGVSNDELDERDGRFSFGNDDGVSCNCSCVDHR